MSIPGPGKYNYIRPFGYDAVKYSIKGKYKATSVERKMDVPGPGQYSSIIKINIHGKYPISRIENVHEVNFGKDKSKRFIYDYNKNPGPADYPQKQLMGNIFDSTKRSNQPRSMYFKYKDVDSREKYPGPGSYRAPSEFGIYESKYAHNNDKKIM